MFLALLKLVGLSILQDLLRPPPEIQHAKPAGIDSFGGPTAESGRITPVLSGRKRLRSPNLLWYGNFRTLPIISYQKIKGLFKSKTVAQITGYRYFIGMHLSLAHAGIETLHTVWSGEKVAWSGSASWPSTVSIVQPNLYGGPSGGGGLVAGLNLLPGGPAQGLNPYLVSQLGATIPAFRNRSSIVMDAEIGTNPNIEPFSFECSRYPALLGLGAIGIDANPAEIAYECLVDTEFGACAATSLVDDATFTACGTTLASENFGISLLWDDAKQVGDFITEGPLRHVDGVIYPDYETAKLTMRLIRDDYDVESLQVLHPGNCELVSAPTASWDGVVNEVKILWDNRGHAYTQDAQPAFSLANLNLQDGRPTSASRQYPGITVADLAARVAQRDMRALGVPYRKATIRANRMAYQLKPGSVFVLRWSPLGISQMVMRVTRVRPGPPGSGRDIEIECVQDVFSLVSSAFAPAPATEWSDPIAESEAVTVQRVDEAPYLLLQADDGSAGPGTIDPDEARLMVEAVRPNSSTLRAGIETRIDPAEYRERGSLEQFTPSGTLVDPYPANTDAVDESETLIIEGLDPTDATLLENASAAQVSSEFRNFAYIEDELIAWETITDNEDGTWTLSGVWRAVMDTTPVDHAAGARIWFSSEGSASTMDTYAEGDDVDARLVPSTPRGELEPDDATPVAHVITRRSLRPIPPGRVRMNTVAWPQPVHLPDAAGENQEDVLTGPLVVSWAHRDRLADPQVIVDQEATSVGPEAGTTYTVRIYDEDDVLAHTEAGLSGTTYTWPLATELAETGRYNERIRVEIESVRDGYASHQFQGRIGDFGGYGMRYGENYGGAG